MFHSKFFVHSRPYSDTFGNQPYSMSMRENIEVTTLDFSDYSSDYLDEVVKLREARITEEGEKCLNDELKKIKSRKRDGFA